MTMRSTNWADVLDPRFLEVFDDEYTNIPDYLEKFYRVKTGKLQTERFSQAGALPDMPQFTGTVTYNDPSQGYDSLFTSLEFAQGTSVEYRLVQDDQMDIIMNKPKALAQSVRRRRETDAARFLNSMFSVDTFFYENTEAVALSSNSHTTTSGASTATGFDNYVTTAMSATSVQALRIQMLKHRNDQGQVISINPDALIYPIDLEETAYEIVKSQGKVDQATNNVNFNEGRYKLFSWIRFTDVNNWAMVDSDLMKRWGLIWIDRVKGEFAMVEDFDTLIAKWRAYCRWGGGHVDWRWLGGAEVT